jgi:hypothetical protein
VWRRFTQIELGTKRYRIPPSSWGWLAFTWLFRFPIDWAPMRGGLLVSAVHTAVFLTLAVVGVPPPRRDELSCALTEDPPGRRSIWRSNGAYSAPERARSWDARSPECGGASQPDS